ncbi:3-dehydroquinate dehydratase [Fervidicella metallireducens AeB]|uniref:3-dehydroquinate dehydratase n=1 Tax=Fervidicella metallireducens AeB TaxID=1403537 RepID=A0A017RY38_9CLOT|nr:type II 3-dehydroquinate dehydratase [Fervidicella metallireducens]EYE89688.1 3-dehydroquinate dehydratase [Fervidicella metallireducens AeB]
MKIIIINGVNLNLLGQREPHIYGNKGYDELCKDIISEAERLAVEVKIVQSNVEGEIVNFIHQAQGKYDGIIINPGAYTHYSYAIYDALKSVDVPAVEVHLSNIHSREEFRKNSVVAPACIGQISGFGTYGYIMALHAIIHR